MHTLLPTAAKALELFMQNVINGAAQCSRDRSAKTVTPFHLYVFGSYHLLSFPLRPSVSYSLCPPAHSLYVLKHVLQTAYSLQS